MSVNTETPVNLTAPHLLSAFMALALPLAWAQTGPGGPQLPVLAW